MEYHGAVSSCVYIIGFPYTFFVIYFYTFYFITQKNCGVNTLGTVIIFILQAYYNIHIHGILPIIYITPSHIKNSIKKYYDFLGKIVNDLLHKRTVEVHWNFKEYHQIIKHDIYVVFVATLNNTILIL